MKMDGEKIINAPKQEVWDALNNPEKLKLAIPGAENVEKKDENNLTATVKTKIGPISAKFTGNIILSNINKSIPESTNINEVKFINYKKWLNTLNIQLVDRLP